MNLVLKQVIRSEIIKRSFKYSNRRFPYSSGSLASDGSIYIIMCTAPRHIILLLLAVLSNLDSTFLNQVGNEEIEKEIEESSKLKAAIQKRIVNIDLTNTANSSRDEELESSAASKNLSKKIKLKWTKKICFILGTLCSCLQK